MVRKVKNGVIKKLGANRSKWVVSLVLSLSLIFLLRRIGRLDFSRLTIALDHPFLIVLCMLITLITLCFSSQRWLIILKSLDLQVTGRETYILSFMAFSVGLLIPGGVGGDLARIGVLTKDNRSVLRPVITSVFADRVTGVLALFFNAVIAGGFLLWNGNSFEITTAIRGSLIALMFGLLLLLSPWILPDSFDFFNYAIERAEKFVTNIRIRNYATDLKALYLQYRGLKRQPLMLLKAGVLSIIVHGLGTFLFVIIDRIVFADSNHSPEMIYILVPLGLLLSSVQMFPGGLGTGQVIFSYLFSVAGISGGAELFSLYLIFQFAMATIVLAALILGKSYAFLDATL